VRVVYQLQFGYQVNDTNSLNRRYVPLGDELSVLAIQRLLSSSGDEDSQVTNRMLINEYGCLVGGQDWCSEVDGRRVTVLLIERQLS
jgi:hypothetical protein